MIAALTMYDRTENAEAHDAFYVAIKQQAADQGIDLPTGLTRGVDELSLWADPDLVLGQICNLPFRQHFHDRLHIIGALDYGLSDVSAGQYNSVIITRPDQRDAPLGDLRFAYNGVGSNSGWDIAHLWAQGQGQTLRPTLETGGHVASIRAVAHGHADIAAIDCIAYVQSQRWDAFAAQTVPRATTAATAGMLLVTPNPLFVRPLFNAIQAAILALDATERLRLGINGIVPIDLKTVLSYAQSGKTA